MAKKVDLSFMATASKNLEKGGAWLASVSVWEVDPDEMGEGPRYVNDSAWTNLSACKRWIKSEVLAVTPRKSIKLLPDKFNEKEKPIKVTGSLKFKGEALERPDDEWHS